MKKKILLIILIIILIKIVILSVITITNKTFYKKYFETNNSSNEKVKIPLPLFSYFKEETGDHNVTFNTLKSVKTVQPILSKYVENLQSCYDEGYFYDEDLDITISRYYIEDSFPFNKIYLNYEKGNRCENEFVLDDNWMTDIIDNAKIDEVNIDQCVINNSNVQCNTKKINDISKVFNYVSDKKFTRIENKNNIGENVTSDYYLISGYYMLDKRGYSLMAFNYNGNLAFKVTDADDHSKNAIYDIDGDINELFKYIFDNLTD